MICIKCKNKNNDENEVCWKCGIQLKNEQGNKINVEVCPHCKSENLESEDDDEGISDFFSGIIWCIVGVLIGKNLHNAIGEVIFYIGIMGGAFGLISGIKSFFTNTTPITITCKDCQNHYDTRKENDN